MALGAILGSVVKGGAKKIAANKLLNRKKKPQKTQAGGEEQEKGGPLAIRPTTALVASSAGALAKVKDSGGAGGEGGTPEEVVSNISSKIIRVERLLKGSVAIKERARENARKQGKIDEDKEQEKGLEKFKPKGIKFKIPGAEKAKSLLGTLVNFFSSILFGWLAVRLVDWLPKLVPLIKTLATWSEWIIKTGGVIIDALAGVIDWGYKLVDGMSNWVKDTFGEEAGEKFTTFLGNLKTLVSGFLVWKIIGKKIVDGIVLAIRTAWNAITTAIRTVWVKLRRLIGRKARIFFKNLAKSVGGVVQNIGTGIVNVGKNVVGRVGGLFSQGAGVVAQTPVGKVATKLGGWASQLFGKAANTIAPLLKGAMPAIKGFAKRIPIFGSLIVGLISLMSGEPIGQAVFKMIGAGVGGALGTFIPIPVLGTLLGETIGAFVGDLLYYTIIEKNPKKAMELFRGALSNIFRAGEFVFNFFKEGIGRFIDNFPMVAVPDFRPGDIIAKMLMGFPGGLDILGLEVPKWVPGIGGASVIGFLQGLPGLQEVLGFFAQYVPGLKRYVKGGRLLGMPNLLMLTPLGLPFLTPLLAKSFLPGLLGEPTPPEGISMEAPQPPEKVSGSEIRAESKRRKEEADRKRREAMQKKLNEIKEGAGKLLQKANPMNWFKKEEKESETSMLTGGMLAQGGSVNLHKGEIVVDPDSAGPAKDMLLAVNEASTYEGIVNAIKKFAPYDAMVPETITLPSAGLPIAQDKGMKNSSPGFFHPVGGKGDDPYEVLDFFG